MRTVLNRNSYILGHAPILIAICKVYGRVYSSPAFLGLWAKLIDNIPPPPSAGGRKKEFKLF
ncbi:MAG: hypothetical protein LBR79_07080 [Oscillospiraceae bacterium]|nr:hypothetical protein [Oscillospiraceae bacterium]